MRLAAAHRPRLTRLIPLFGFFVLIQFVGGVAWCTMSSTVYYWYFFFKNPKEKMRFPLASSLGRTLFFHTGSVAFSAFVIAICDYLRYRGVELRDERIGRAKLGCNWCGRGGWWR